MREGLAADIPVTGVEDRLARFEAATAAPKPEGQVDPTFPASIGGAETILPNIAKTAGNIPSSVANLAERAIGDPVRNIKESAKVGAEIVKDQGVKEGAKNVVEGLNQTIGDILKAPGKFLVGKYDKEKFFELQKTHRETEDKLLDLIYEKRKKGEDTSRLTSALSDLIASKKEVDNEAGGTPEDRYNKGVENLTNIAKFPIERPADVAAALYTGPKAAGAKATDAISEVAQATTGGLAKKAETALGETASKVKGSVLGKVDEAKVALQDKAVNNLEADYSRWAGQTKGGVKKIGKAETKTLALNEAGTSGKAPQRILAESKIIPETEGTKFRTADQAKKFKESLQPLYDANTDALKLVDQATPPISIDDLQANTVKSIESSRLPVGEKATMVNDAKSEYSLLKEKYGDTIKPSDLNAEKQNYSGSIKFDSTKPLKKDTYYQIRKTAQKTIEDTASKAGFEDVAQLNREIGDRLSAADFLEGLDGQTLKYGKIGKYAFMGIGATLGKGITGKVLGALGGELVAELLMRADVASPVKRLVLKSLETRSPEAYKATLEWIKQQGLEKDLRLALPAPTPLGSPGNPIIPRHTEFEAPSQNIAPTRTFNPKNKQYYEKGKMGGGV